jgi:hypothetical protein
MVVVETYRGWLLHGRQPSHGMIVAFSVGQVSHLLVLFFSILKHIRS